MNELTLEEAAEIVKNTKENQVKLANHFSTYFKLADIKDFLKFCLACGFEIKIDTNKLTDEERKFIENK